MQDEIHQSVMRASVNFEIPRTRARNILRFSDAAQSFIDGLLQEDPLERMLAHEALQHPWLAAGTEGVSKAETSQASSAADSNNDVADRIKEFSALPKVSHIAMSCPSPYLQFD